MVIQKRKMLQIQNVMQLEKHDGEKIETHSQAPQRQKP